VVHPHGTRATHSELTGNVMRLASIAHGRDETDEVGPWEREALHGADATPDADGVAWRALRPAAAARRRATS